MVPLKPLAQSRARGRCMNVGWLYCYCGSSVLPIPHPGRLRQTRFLPVSLYVWASKGPEPGRVQPSSARAAHVVGPSPWVGHLFAGTHGDLFVLDETGQGLGMV